MFTPPASQEPVASSVNWISSTLLGEVAVTLCVIAIAFVGFSMLTGRISLRRGGQVILGCFILLGAPLIANTMLGAMGSNEDSGMGRADTVVYETQPREELPPADYNPYAGASLRRGYADGQ